MHIIGHTEYRYRPNIVRILVARNQLSIRHAKRILLSTVRIIQTLLFALSLLDKFIISRIFKLICTFEYFMRHFDKEAIVIVQTFAHTTKYRYNISTKYSIMKRPGAYFLRCLQLLTCGYYLYIYMFMYIDTVHKESKMFVWRMNMNRTF